MSSEQSYDPHLIEQTKQQIRVLVQEIAQISKSELAPEQFYSELLPRVVSALAAIGGVVWTMGDQGRLSLQYQVNLQQTRLPESDEEQQVNHARLLHKVMTTGESLVIPPHSGAEDGEQGSNPTDYLLVLGALKTELEVVGVLEIFQRPEPGPAIQKGYLRFVQQMCDLAGEFLKTRQLRHFSDRQVLWTQLEEFARQVHASLHPRETAYTIANEGRRLIECDRVSVAIRKGNRCTVEAVSGQDLFDKRSNTVRLLNRLASVVVASEEPMWYTGDTRNLAPQVEDALQEYVDETHTKMVAVLPLRRPQQIEQEREKPGEAMETPPVVGALIVEQIEDSRLEPKTRQRVDVVCQHSAAALANAMEHHSLFLMPLWRALGKTRVVTRARTLPKVLIVLGLVLGAVITMAVVPADFALRSKGTIEPVVKRNVYAETGGNVIEVLIDHGQVVQKGQVLVRLRNPELTDKKNEVTGKLKTAKESLNKALRTLFQERLAPGDHAKLTGEVNELKSTIASLESMEASLQGQVDALVVRSPVAGRVITWDPEKRLIGRPVEKGQTLLTIANTEGDWELEMHMPEDRIAFIRRAQQEFGDQLEVSFVVANEPGRTHYGYVREMEYSAEPRGEEGVTVLIKVDFDKAEFGPEKLQLQQGTTVTAKVACGRRALGYVLFHDLAAWVQKMLFRWF
jgi:multidrug efflux pump subunit AcrA (membrane-fusion protein)